MSRFSLTLVGLAVVVLAALAWAVSQAWQSTERRLQGERRLIAERLFDEFERVLAVFVDRERQRPVTHYRSFHVPAELLPGSIGIGLSPLATAAEEPFVRGHLQWDADGRVGSPRVPENAALATQLGLSVDAAAVTWLADWRDWTRAHTAVLAACLPPGSEQPQFLQEAVAAADPAMARSIDEQSEPAAGSQSERAAPSEQEGALQVQAPVQQLAELPRNQLLQQRIRGVYQAEEVNRQRVEQMPASTLDEYVNPVDNVGKELYLSNSWQVQNGFPLPTELEEPEAGQSVGSKLSFWNDSIRARFGSDLDQSLPVTIGAFHGRVIDAERALLVRRVGFAGGSVLQGIVIDLPRLVAHLEERVLDDELRRVAQLDWNWSPESDAAGSFRQRLAAPFDGLAVGCALPGLVEDRSGITGILAIALLVIGVVVVGFWFIGRGVVDRMEYARRRQDFVAAVSHELRTPLTSIRLYGEMLRDGLVASDDKRRQYYQIITGESERLSRLIDNVLTLARLERGEQCGGTSTGSVVECLDEVVAVVGPHCRAQDFELVIETAEDLPPVTIDRDGLIQALLNLIDNSVKFGAASQPRRIELSASADGERVRLVVRDHGPGVSAAQCQRLLEPFYRAENENTRRTRGTGIGLALVDRLIRGMGGTLRLGNHPEGGLRVELSLPVAAD